MNRRAFLRSVATAAVATAALPFLPASTSTDAFPMREIFGVVDIGPDVLMYNGAPLVFDRYLPQGTMMFVDQTHWQALESHS